MSPPLVEPIVPLAQQPMLLLVLVESEPPSHGALLSKHWLLQSLLRLSLQAPTLSSRRILALLRLGLALPAPLLPSLSAALGAPRLAA